jgi:AraC-like DNA-binding protein
MIQLEEVRPAAFQTAVAEMAERLGHSVLADLAPVIDAIAASLRGRQVFERPDVSVTLPVTKGRTLVVSVRTGNPRARSRAAAPVRGLDARQLGLVKKTIDDNLAEPISVSMLSTVAGLSRSYFSHAFRRSLGRSPHAHIVRLRIDRAMTLMRDSDVPLSEIALAVGFSDQAHFSNTFRRATGMTPTQWRKEHAAA